jgi:hypothetical protein
MMLFTDVAEHFVAFLEEVISWLTSHARGLQGKCDASVLLKGTSTTKTELDSTTNLTLRGLDFIDFLKSMLTKANCTQVSCADIVALSARDAVVAVSGLNSLP